MRLPGGQIQSLPKSEQAYAYLLIDCSSSMDGNKILQAKEGAIVFAQEAVKKEYCVGLIRFSDTAEVLSSLSQESPALISKLHLLEPDGGTNMTDALNLAIRELSTVSGRRAIVIATDGAPNSVDSSLYAAQRAKDLGIDIIAIGTDDADQDFLARLATRSDLSVKVPSKYLKSSISEAVQLLPSAARRNR